MNSVSPDQPPQIHFERPPTDPERQAKRLPIRIIRMLSARSQHMLRTEYLQPLQPTTLDAKKSPLALLAQTCSSIGKDTELPSKQASSSIEKDQRTSSSSPSKSSVVDGDKSSFKPYKKEEKTEGESSSKSGFHTPNSTAGSTAGDKTPAGSEHESERKAENTSTSTVTSSSTSTLGVSHSRINVSCGGMFVEVNHHETSSGGNSTEKSSLSVQPSHLSPSSPKPGHSSIAPHPCHLPGALSCGAGCACGSGSSLLDPSKGAMTAQLPSTLPPSMAAGKLDASPLAGGTAPNPYAYVKTSTGATALMPICRDPYCTNCQGAQLAAAAGCKQCTHDTPYPSPFPYLPLGHPGLYSAATSMAGGLGTPMYSPYSTMLPHVCNWVSGTSSCGKRFATSEELLQHLRTHTMSGSQAGSLSIPSLTSSALNGCHFHYPSAASAAGLLRPGYPTSPVNGLHSYRYHPYKPPMPTGAPPSLAMPSLQLHAPTPGAFYSPYGLYAARLGAPTVGYP